MKKVSVFLAVVGLGGATAAGNVYAGSGCFYGQQKGELASVQEASPIDELGQVDPALLALLKKQEAQRQAALQDSLPIVHN